MSDLEIIRELQDTKCRCGARKSAMQTFCRACYFALSPKLRRDLYKHVSEGYCDVYREAAGILDATKAKASKPGELFNG